MESVINNPLVSVIMPVFNGERFLKTAIESILSQTFEDFEFLIINDGSTDRSLQIINSIQDNRIICLQNLENKGLVISLNKAITAAKGKYIARFDADDIALPNRLKEQFNFLEKNPDIALVGSNVQFLINNKLANISDLPITNEAAKCRLIFNTTFVHPAVMLQTKVLKTLKYDAKTFPTEDYDLWVRLTKHHKVANLNQVLLHCRLHDKNIHLNTRIRALDSLSTIYKHIFMQTFSYSMTTENIKTHQTLSLYDKDFSVVLNEKIELWLTQLQALNKQKGVFSTKLFNKQLAEIWIRYAYYYIRFGKKNMNIMKSNLIFHAPIMMTFRVVLFSILNLLKLNKNA